VTWTELWKREPQRIKFLIQAVYDMLPSPSNLHIWGKVESPAWPLCSKSGTLRVEHILSSCSKALGEERHRWRHDQVLKTIAEVIAAGVEWAKCSRLSKQAIIFIKAGEQPQKHLQASWPLQGTVSCWWTWTATQVPQPYCDHHLKTRCCSLV